MPNPMILKIRGGVGEGVPCNQVVNSRHPTRDPGLKFIFRRASTALCEQQGFRSGDL
jgi:hypothetical protein